MIGWIALRTARRALRNSGESRPKVETKPWGEIRRMPMGAWAFIIFATLFVTSVILIGWFVNSHP